MDTVPLVVVEVAVESGPKFKDVAISSMLEVSGAFVIVAVSCPFISLIPSKSGAYFPTAEVRKTSGAALQFRNSQMLDVMAVFP